MNPLMRVCLFGARSNAQCSTARVQISKLVCLLQMLYKLNDDLHAHAHLVCSLQHLLERNTHLIKKTRTKSICSNKSLHFNCVSCSSHGTATTCIFFILPFPCALWLIHNRIADSISFSIKSAKIFFIIMSYLGLNNNTTRTVVRCFFSFCNFSLHFIECHAAHHLSCIFLFLVDFSFLKTLLWYFHFIWF